MAKHLIAFAHLYVESARGGEGSVGQAHGILVKGAQRQVVQIDVAAIGSVTRQFDGVVARSEVGHVVGIGRPRIPVLLILKLDLGLVYPVHVNTAGVGVARVVGITEDEGILAVFWHVYAELNVVT